MSKSKRMMKGWDGNYRKAVSGAVFLAMQQQAFRIRLKLAWKILTRADLRKQKRIIF